MKKLIVLILGIMLIHQTGLMAQKQTPVLNHIAVFVVNLKTSADFYRDIIGLDTVPEPFHDGKHTWMSIGSKSNLHIIEGANAVSVHDKNAHLCFSVGSVSDFAAHLKNHRIEYENWAGEKNTITRRVDGVQQIYFKDPDGYWIEINDAKE